jgi:hypothetical protein
LFPCLPTIPHRNVAMCSRTGAFDQSMAPPRQRDCDRFLPWRFAKEQNVASGMVRASGVGLLSCYMLHHERRCNRCCKSRPKSLRVKGFELVGASGFEPPTSWSRTRRASQAALRPALVTANRPTVYAALLILATMRRTRVDFATQRHSDGRTDQA